jgi:3-oxoacyl-[acyl-carrier protein] reductase
MSRKVALITGGGQGIGRASALRLASEGYGIALFGLHKEKVDSVAAEVNGAGGEATAHGVDVSQAAEVRQGVEDVLNTFGRIDVLVNNAGTHEECEVVDLTDEIYDRVIGTNLTGSFLLARAVLPGMIERQSGVIINISSVWAWGVGPGAAPYCASKAGVVSLTKALATEVGKHGIRVNAVAPGLIDTDMYATVNDQQRKLLIEQCPLGRLAAPDEIAGPVSFLVSDDASWITGETLAVAGGMYLR